MAWMLLFEAHGIYCKTLAVVSSIWFGLKIGKGGHGLVGRVGLVNCQLEKRTPIFPLSPGALIFFSLSDHHPQMFPRA